MSPNTSTLSPIAELRRAVLLDPHQDTPRLVLADALEEPGSSEQERQWAELIRCQIKLSRLDSGDGEPISDTRGETDSEWEKRYRLIDEHHARESALLRELTRWLRRGERCSDCKGEGRDPTVMPGGYRPCPDCHGIGWLGSLAEQVPVNAVSLGIGGIVGNWFIPATFARGLVARVELTVEQVQDTAFLRRLFSEWPVTEAGLMGREPWPDSNGLRLLIEDGQTHWKIAPTAEAANAALSRAIVSLGRTAAGLPQIGET